jgi:hypothetical protein
VPKVANVGIRGQVSSPIVVFGDQQDREGDDVVLGYLSCDLRERASVKWIRNNQPGTDYQTGVEVPYSEVRYVAGDAGQHLDSLRAEYADMFRVLGHEPPGL